MPRGKAATAKARVVRVMVVDDHPLWRQTLRDLLEQTKSVNVVGEAGDGAAAVAEAVRLAPDVAVMDLDLPTLSGVEATRQIRAEAPSVKVLVLSSSAAGDLVRQAVRAGACGYLVKTADPADVTDAVRRIHAGELVFPAALTSFVREELHSEVALVKGAVAGRAVLVGGAAPQREALAKALGGRGLDMRTVGSAKALAAAAAAHPDVIVADLSGRATKALADAVAAARTANPGQGVVLLLGDAADPPNGLGTLMGSGGVGYLLASEIASVAELHTVITRVAEGETVIHPGVAQQLLGLRRHAHALDSLTERERAVLALMAEGRSNQAIASALSLSGKTIETHIAGIFNKLGLDATSDHHRRVLAVVAYLQAS